jgi:Raf kinase inhibitor-like YbhB/YbcL family protein
MTRPGTRAAVGLLAVIAGCSSIGPSATPGQEVATMNLTSGSFEDGGSIPSRYTCDGADVSPPLAWDAVPEGSAAFALIVDDPDARGFVHWVLSDIPGDARELPEGEGDTIGMPGPNDFGRTGWGGPCPPSGEHRYVFTLYALSEPIGEAAGADAVREAAGAALATATLTGVYARR